MPAADQTAKWPTSGGWPFCAQINDLPESDVERAMGIENVDPGMAGSLTTPLAGCTLAGFPLALNGFAGLALTWLLDHADVGHGSGWLELDATVTRT